MNINEGDLITVKVDLVTGLLHFSSEAHANMKMEERREKGSLSANYKTDFNTYYTPVTTSYQPENYNPHGQLSAHHLQKTT